MKRPLILFGLLAAVLASAQTAHAASSSFFGPIVPAVCQSSCPCGFASVLETIRNLMNLGISLAIIIGVLIIVYAGVMYIVSASNPEGRSSANKMLMNAIIGLVIVLSAWLIVDFVMKKLYDPKASNFGPWNSIIIGGDFCIKPSAAHSVDGLPGALSTLISGGTIPSGSTANANDAAVRKQLMDAGVHINHAACPATSDGIGCTNVGGMQPATVSQILAIRDAVCGSDKTCTITVTGGTEPGHAGSGAGTHAGGYKVDISDTGAVNAVLGALTPSGQRGGDTHNGPIFVDHCNNQYVHETDLSHWDISVTSVCVLK